MVLFGVVAQGDSGVMLPGGVAIRFSLVSSRLGLLRVEKEEAWSWGHLLWLSGKERRVISDCHGKHRHSGGKKAFASILSQTWLCSPREESAEHRSSTVAAHRRREKRSCRRSTCIRSS